MDYTKAYQAEYYQRNKERLNKYKKDYAKNVTNKLYKRFAVYLDKDLMNELEKYLIKNNITKTDFVKKCIMEYLNEQ